jgi:putative methyltransferase (TIGR04325 family)
MIHHYCTYFDHNYLPRALLMIESLRAQRAAFHLHVVCLSDLCVQLLRKLVMPEVSIIELESLERRYPDLLAVKAGDRTPIEYIFTMTPFMPSYCLEATPGLTEITYLDSDLYFYDDPQLVFDHIGSHSIAIIPHRFSPDQAEDRQYGEFNVGWITFRATPEGLRCLSDWQRDCLDWCYDRLEDDRFADQRYLDRWPQAYKDLKIVSLKGANVATYNVDNYAVIAHDGRFWCDEEPLIFYHFHSVVPEPDGTYFARFPAAHFHADGVVMRRLYRPYLARLLEKTHALHVRFAELANAPRLSRPGLKVFRPPLRGWPDDLVSQARALRALELRDHLGEADTLAKGAPRLAQVAEALRGARAGIDRLSVLDWGGGYGEYAWAARGLFPDLAIDYHIVEVATVCDYGGALFTDVTYHDRDETAFAHSYDVVLAIGSLQYAADWRGTVERLAKAARRFLIVMDLPVSSGAEGFTLTERPLGYMPQAVCLASIADAADLCERVAQVGLTLERDLVPWRLPPIRRGAIELTYRSFLFRRADSAACG